MALHRKVLQDIKFVCSFDPAVESGYGDYKAGGYDFSKLVMHEGQRPTVFYLCQMSHAAKNLASSYEGRAKQSMEIACALVRVEDYEVVSDVGDSSPMRAVQREPQGLIGQMVKDQWMKDAALHQSVIDELAAAINETSDPSPFS